MFTTFNTIFQISTTNKEFSAIEHLYTETFSKGVSAQFIDKTELINYLQNILDEGCALQYLEDNKLIACLLYSPLTVDRLCPTIISKQFDKEKCVYIAEIMVDESYRGKGIAKALITEFFRTVDPEKYSDAFIRVWDKNIAAVQLYLKMGFTLVAHIEQTKKAMDGKSEFIMNKIYLHKHLSKQI